MRTNIEIDDKLMREAMKASGTKTKKECVDWALRRALQIFHQSDILKLRGKVRWEGNLEESRLGRLQTDDLPRRSSRKKAA